MDLKKVPGIFLIAIIVSFPSFVFAENTKVSDILGSQEIDNKIISELDAKEEERESGFENQLLLQIPLLTDNPSHILTFTDPSSEKDGVLLEIDGTKYIEIKSPYALPALGIGEHLLKFKFTDKEGATQILEKELTIIPRPPIIKAPQVDGNNITLTGTGLANSELIILLSSGVDNYTENVDIDNEGNWSKTFDISDSESTLFNVSAYTRKYGFASNLSEIITFNTDLSLTKSSNNNKAEEIVFSISSLSDPIGILKKNTDFAIYTVIVFAIGFLFSLGIFNLVRKNKEDNNIKSFKNTLKTDTTSSEKPLTLRERLSQESNNSSQKEEKKETPKKEDIKEEKSVKKEKEEKVKEEKVVSKEDFMKDFKKFDPDKDNGKENKKIKISLTSQND